MARRIREIEESDDVLDFDETNPVEFWEAKQRELFTSVVDYNLGGLADLVQSKAIDLSPGYQRRFRWDEVRKSKLIESFLMNVPVPPIFLNEDTYGQYSVIDGKQRLNAITEFMRGRLKLTGLKVFQDINGKTFDDLPVRFQNVIRTRPNLRAVIILRQSDEDVKLEVFQRLNTGGVRLNPQEIRNSSYTGSLNDLILDLSVNKQFHKMLGIKNKETSAIYQEMRDAEFVLRFFTFRTTWQTFSGGVAMQLSRFMAEHRHPDIAEIDDLRQTFCRTLELVDDCFGEYAFHRWTPEKNQWGSQVVAALYDAQMLACQSLDAHSIDGKQDALIDGMKELFNVPSFRSSVDAATNNRSSFEKRILLTRQMIEQVIG